jgi:hypothetical protein
LNKTIVTVVSVTIILLTFFSVSHLSAATYYVSSSVGNDSNSGTSTYPWKSLSKVNSSLFNPGDSILFKTGDTWRETLTVSSSGSAGNVITFGAYGSGTAPIIDATGLNWGINSSGKDYITITGLEIKNSNQYGIRNRGGSGWLITLNTVHHIGSPGADWPSEGIAVEGQNTRGSNNTVSWNTVYQTGRHGVDLTAFENGTITSNIIEHNTIYNSYHTGIDMQNIGPTSTFSGNILRYNTIYADRNYANFSIGCAGIFTMASSGLTVNATQIYYNLIYNMPGTGIQIYDRSTNTVIYNNTIANKNASHTGWADAVAIRDTAVSGTIVKNNIAYGFDGAFWVLATGACSGVDYNDWYTAGDGPRVTIGVTKYRAADQAAYKSATGYDIHGKWADPLFVSTSDFHLKSTSPCINAGTDVSLTKDYDGNVVPVGGVPDIGVYEYNPDSTKPKTPTGVRILN